MKLFITVSFLLLFPLVISAESVSSHSHQVTVSINHADGGMTTKRHMNRLFDALNDGGCQAVLHDSSSAAAAQLIFDPRPVSVVMKQRPDYRLIARARTLDGQFSVRGAIVVNGSTGITDLETLKNEWISFISRESWAGYRLPLQMLQAAGINETTNSFYIVGNHIGVVGALLHNDVHVAVTVEPLAKRWLEQNNLLIVAVTDEVETGGWWMQRSMAENMTRNCVQSVIKLNVSQLKALPGWISGFVSAE